MVYSGKIEGKKVNVVFEDEYLMIVEKPSGVVTTREMRVGDDGMSYLEDWVGEYFPNEINRKGIVHRLDKDTSGLVVVAKTEEARTLLNDIFKQRKITKKYLAVVGGDLPKVGDMNMPIKRSKYYLGRFKVDADGKNAVTEFRVLKKLKIDGKMFSLVEVNLKTGRTHQIRVHFSYLGWPLMGDAVYKGYNYPGLNRQFLHSAYIKFVHPKTLKVIEINSLLPSELQEIIDKYGV